MLKKICGILKLYTVYASVGIVGYPIYAELPYLTFYIRLILLSIIFLAINALIMYSIHDILCFKRTGFYILKLIITLIVGTIITFIAFLFSAVITLSLEMGGFD